MRPGSEEYLDSEKFQLRPRDWAARDAEGRTLAPYLTLLNDIRRRAPGPAAAAQPDVPPHRQRQVIVYSKQREASDTVLVVVNVDPHGARETTVHLNMPALGLGWNDAFAVHDEITGAT